MVLTDFKKNNIDGQTRVSMKVSWENSDRKPREIFIETPEQFGSDLECNPNAFLLAAVMPALAHREKRILVEGSLCPHLRNGLETVMLIYRSWYEASKFSPVEIEASKGFQPLPPPTHSQTASFMSGGVDALCTLITNHQDFPNDHPHRIRDCFFVHGFDIGGYVSLGDNQANSETAVQSLRRLEKEEQVTLIPVRTNIRHIDDADNLFSSIWFGTALSSIAHAFSKRNTRTLIASGASVDDLSPRGSHPLTDQYFSSSNMAIVHDGTRFFRHEKVGVISKFPTALLTLRACFNAFRPADALNCSRCEKCLRTMTSLLIHNKLGKCPSYLENDVTPSMIGSLNGTQGTYENMKRKDALRVAYLNLTIGNNHFWREMIEPLEKMGRNDLAEAIRNKTQEYDRYIRKKSRIAAFKAFIKKWDQRFLGSRLSAFKNRKIERIG